MKNILLSALNLLILLSCSNGRGKELSRHRHFTSDTILGTRQITDELAGSTYRKRANVYFTIIKSDTSEYKPVFYELKEDGRIVIDQNLDYSTRSSTYAKSLQELQLILPKAAEDYNFDSLKYMYYGRLIQSGDLAITITNEYKNRFGESEIIRTSDYSKISNFLMESTLVRDLNQLFSHHSKYIEKLGIEKAFFTDNVEVIKQSLPEGDSTKVPDKVIDFMIWLEFNDD
ncbi:hypothetical protein [Saccharicrinis aurantiacus]|uniref:hypothetical protein n=1 Tax=Saccharicrinis aurantiacus TaxID=1849719 RepID=UPI000838CE37|nr:hypothetical protein [Saccharicrinis aurantiacus]